MKQTASRAWGLAAACAIAATQAGAQSYGDPYANPQRPYATQGAQRIVRCESSDWNRNFCAIPIRPNDRVTVFRRYSERGCVRGRTWFVDPRGIWVDNGCRADFLVVARRPMRPPTDYDGDRGRPRDRDNDNGGYGSNGYGGDRYDDRSSRQGPDPYAPRDRGVPPPDRYDNGNSGYGQEGPPAQAYDRDAQRHGSVTVRDPDNPQDRGRRMEDCDQTDERDARDDCGPPPTGADPYHQ